MEPSSAAVVLVRAVAARHGRRIRAGVGHSTRTAAPCRTEKEAHAGVPDPVCRRDLLARRLRLPLVMPHRVGGRSLAFGRCSWLCFEQQCVGRNAWLNKPFFIDVITMPPLVCGARFEPPVLLACWKERIRLLLRHVHAANSTSRRNACLVLGAWGCGYSANPSSIVAEVPLPALTRWHGLRRTFASAHGSRGHAPPCVRSLCHRSVFVSETVCRAFSLAVSESGQSCVAAAGRRRSGRCSLKRSTAQCSGW